MNRKQFVILLVLVAILGATGLAIHQRSQQSWHSAGQSIGQKLLPDFPVNEIAQITVKSGANQLNLARRDQVWSVAERGNYPANFSQISDLLLKFADLKIAQVEEIGPSQLGRFELLPAGDGANTGTQIEFKDTNGKVRNSVRLGKKHLRKPSGGSQFGGDESWPDGRYVQADDAKGVALIADALDSVQPKPESWLNKDFFSIEKPRSIAGQFPEATNSWKLVREAEGKDWQLTDLKAGEKLDESKISGVTSPFNSPSFNDVLPGDTKPETAGLTNVTTLVIETFDGLIYSLKLGQKHDDNFPLVLTVKANMPAVRAITKDEKPEDKSRLDKEFADLQQKLANKLASESRLTNWIYYVPSYSVESLLKGRSELLTEVKKEDKPAAAAK